MKTERQPKGATFVSNDATSVGIRELRDHLSAFLERVKAGDAITITEHGRPIARITGTSYPPHLLELARQGHLTLATRPKRPASAFPRIPVKGSVSDLISEMRGE